MLFFASIVQASETDDNVIFSRDIAPLLQKNCVACHREKQAEGGLSLVSPKTMLSGSDSGDALVGGDPEASLLLVRAADPDDPMPPEDNTVGAEKLTPQQLDLLRRWIEQGAKFDEAALSPKHDWQPIHPSIQSSFSLSISPDNRLLAVAQANRVAIKDLQSGSTVAELVDPNLPQDGVADVDLIQAIAFSPLGDRIATGGYRSVRIWKAETAGTQTAGTQTAGTQTPDFLSSLIGPIAVSPDRKRVVGCTSLGDIRIIDIESKEVMVEIPSRGTITDVSWRDPAQVLVGFSHGEIMAIDRSDGAERGTLKFDESLSRFEQGADGRFTAAITVSSKLLLFEQLKPVERANLSSVANPSAVAFLSPTKIVIGTNQGEVIVGEVATDQVLHRLKTDAPVRSIAAHADGVRFAVGDENGIVTVFNADDGQLICQCSGTVRSQLETQRLERRIALDRLWIDTLGKQTDPLQKRLETENAALAKVTEAHKKAQTELDEKRKQQSTEKQSIAKTEATILQAKTQIEQMTQAAATAEKLVSTTTDQIAKLSAQLAPLERQSSVAAANLKAAEAKVAEAMKILASAQEANQAAIANFTNQQNQISQTKQRQKDAMAKLDESRKGIATAKTSLDQQTKSLAKQKETLDKANQEVEGKQAELAKRNQALVTATKTRDRAANEIPKHQDVIRQRKSRLSDFDYQLTSHQAKIQHGPAAVGVAFGTEVDSIHVARANGQVTSYDAATGIALHHSVQQYADLDTGATKLIAMTADRCWLSRRTEPPTSMQLSTSWKLDRVIGGLDKDLIADRVTALDFRSDGKSLAIGSGSPSRNGQVLIVDLLSGSVLREFDDLHSDVVLCVEFSPDDQMLATGSADKTIRIVDTQSKQIVGSLDGHTHHVLALAWKHDQKMIASGSADLTIKTWNTATGQRIRSIGGFGDEVTGIQFIGESTQVVSCSADGQIRIHETNNGGQVRASSTGGDYLFSIDLTGDGKRTVAAGYQGKLHVHTVDNLKVDPTWSTQK